MMIIAYYSDSGTTALAAKAIHQLTGGRLVQLKPVKPYPTDYDTLTQVTKQEVEQRLVPALQPVLADITTTETVLLGFPTWYGQAPMLIASFFKQIDLAGKKVIPFNTSVSSTIHEGWSFLEKLATAAQADLRPGFTANSKAAIKQYLTAHQLLAK
jgi:flavodoxin